jgi:hypothetical protein
MCNKLEKTNWGGATQTTTFILVFNLHFFQILSMSFF